MPSDTKWRWLDEEQLHPWQHDVMRRIGPVHDPSPVIWWYDFSKATIPAGKTMFAQYLFEYHNVIVEHDIRGGKGLLRALRYECQHAFPRGPYTVSLRTPLPPRAVSPHVVVFDLTCAGCRRIQWQCLKDVFRAWPTWTGRKTPPVIIVFSNRPPTSHAPEELLRILKHGRVIGLDVHFTSHADSAATNSVG